MEAHSSAVRLATGLDAFFAFVEERRDAWRILFHDAADPETATVLDRILEQVTGLVAALIAEDPGARAIEERDTEQAIRLLAQMLVGSVQSVANWWAEHREVPCADRRDGDGLRLAGARPAQPGRALGAAPMSFVSDVVDGSEPSRRALVCVSAQGERSELSFGEVADRSAGMAAVLAAAEWRRATW